MRRGSTGRRDGTGKVLKTGPIVNDGFMADQVISKELAILLFVVLGMVRLAAASVVAKQRLHDCRDMWYRLPRTIWR